ncbi:hypothetical protein GCM10023114_32990 [Mycolicibacterium sediminis]|uniref:Uncharacterized protein n=1 Tax=Mycolicibacterium sediminis TaxID=1286180 RepID=A0A7I7QZ35_9MYCO|nr:hypothetical protein MSEDJ_57450 [Mycolicibacterium sediminis]
MPASVGDRRFRNRVIAARAVMTAVIAQPCNRSSGPKSATGSNGAGLITGTPRWTAAESMVGALTTAIVGCAV